MKLEKILPKEDLIKLNEAISELEMWDLLVDTIWVPYDFHDKFKKLKQGAKAGELWGKDIRIISKGYGGPYEYCVYFSSKSNIKKNKDKYPVLDVMTYNWNKSEGLSYIGRGYYLEQAQEENIRLKGKIKKLENKVINLKGQVTKAKNKSPKKAKK